MTPTRTCLGCRTQAPQADLVRIVAAGGEARIDVRRRLPGRGAYLHPDAGCLELAVRRRAVPRALRAEAAISWNTDDLLGAYANSRESS